MLDSLLARTPAPAVTNSLNNRAWFWRTGCDRTAFAIAQTLELPEIVARILAARGIGIEAAADFLTPTLRALLPDPSTLADMDAASTRLAHTVETGEMVAVFGDYDVDGACSAAIITLFLRGLGCAVLPYVPDRLAEGYGPNAPALNRLADRGATLVVCVDCGTAAADALATLHGRADIIVLDHHKAEGPPPPILATVNPNRLDCRSSLKNLCAAAIAFLAAIATLRALRAQNFFAARPEPDLKTMLDMVALATVCDVMPLTGLNRAFVTQGLRILRRRERPGLAALMDVAATRGEPTATTCGFGIGPRINAGGRISEADLGLRLLLCDDPLEARLLAERLDAVNRQRQAVEQGMMDEAIAAAQAQIDAGYAAILVTGQDWHPGVVGIVASRLKELFNRPACVGGGGPDGLIKGSGRSVPGLDLGAAIIAARQSGLIRTGGGHAMAAGFSLAPGTEAAFHDFLCDRLPVDRTAPRRPHLMIEASLDTAGATAGLATQLARLAPFGTAHEEPVLFLPGIRVQRTQRLGNDANTLRADVSSEGGPRLKTLMFRAGDGPIARALEDRATAPLHLAGHLRAETWQGRESVCFQIVDAALQA